MAESELGVLASQCLNRSIADKTILVRELTLVTVAGRRQEPAMARLVRTFGMKPGQDEACDEDASSPPLVMVSKRIGSSSAELVARVIGTEGTVSSA